MSIVSVSAIQMRGRSGGVSLSNGFERHHTQSWKVKTSGFDGDMEVVDAVPVALGDHYTNGVEEDLFSYCDSIEATADDEYVWTVTATYNRFNPEYNQVNPLDNRPSVSIEWQPEQEICEVDLNGNPCVASNGLPFDPAITRDRSIHIIRIQQNRSAFDFDLVFNYQNTINSDNFLGFDPGTVKVMNITASDAYDAVIGKYWKYNFEFGVDMQGWSKKVFDMGFYELDTALNQYVPILIDGKEPSQPVPLDGAGRALIPPVDSSSLVQLEFTLYPEIDLGSATGFDSSIFT